MELVFKGNPEGLMNYLTEEICEHCDGAGEVEILEHVRGDNISPGGFYQGSGRFEKCVCQLEVED